jgi:uncharacterized protein involved in cysteine biosynthesis
MRRILGTPQPDRKERVMTLPKGLSLRIRLNRVNPGHYAGWSGPLFACEADAEDVAKIARKPPPASLPRYPRAVPSLPPGGPARLAFGLALPLRALSRIAGDRVLLRWSVVPAALTLLGVVGGLVAAAPASGWLLGLAWPEPPGAAAGALWWLARVALWLALVYLVAIALPVIVAAPACEVLSARTEATELGDAGRSGGVAGVARETAAGIGHALASAALLAGGHAVLLLLLLVPGLNVVYAPLAFLWTARWTAFGYLSIPLARDGATFREVARALRAARPAGLGLGLALAVLFLVPLANLLVVPLGAVAGTLLYCDLVRAGVIARRVEAATPPAVR